jgi:TldD protein
VRLAPVKGVGEVAWATPIKKDWRAVPVKEKAEMLIAANKAGLDAGASFMTANLFQVNQQKYFASTDGSYIDQDIHRLWAPLTATAVDKATGKFRSRAGLAPPVGMGYEYFDVRPEHKVQAAGGVTTLYKVGYDIVEERATPAARRAKAGPSRRAGQVRPGAGAGTPVPDHPRIGRPPDGTGPRAGLRSQLRRHQLRTLDKWETKKFKFGAERVNFFADKPRPVRWARSATTTKA